MIGLLNYMCESIISTERKPHRLLRFFTHIVISLRLLGGLDDENDMPGGSGDRVIVAYIRELVTSGYDDRVAYYVGHLNDAELQIKEYVKFLQGVHESDRRKNCHEIALANGLDWDAITQRLVGLPGPEDVIFAQSPESIPVKPVSAVGDDADAQISAIEWLTFKQSQAVQALIQGNRVVRGLLLAVPDTVAWPNHANIDHANTVLKQKIPPESIDAAKQEWSEHSNDQDMPQWLTEAILEYTGAQNLMTAIHAFIAWQEEFHTREWFATQSQAKVSVGLGGQAARRSYREREQAARHRVDELAHNAKQHIERVLIAHQNSGQWLLFEGPPDMNGPEGTQAKTRQDELEKLREKYITKLCLGLQDIFSKMKWHRECLKMVSTCLLDNSFFSTLHFLPFCLAVAGDVLL